MKGSLHTDELMARGGEARHRPAHRAPHQPLLRDGRAGASRRADHLRRRGEHRADARGQGRHRAERDRPRPRAARPGGAGRDPVGDGDGQPEGALDDRGGGAVQDGRPRPDHRRHPRRPARARQRDQPGGGARSRRSSRRSPDARTCSIVPDLEAGNMLAKSLSFLAGADAAGIVLGAKVPIILTSRADSVIARLASCAVAVAGRRRRGARERRRKAIAAERGPMTDAILVLNAGSSSIKFSLFAERGGELAAALPAGRSRASTPRRASSRRTPPASRSSEKQWEAGTKLGHDGALAHIVDWLRATHGAEHRLAAVGHRVVHGGTDYAAPVRVDAERRGEAREARAARAAAPAAQPRADPRAARSARRSLPQVACFDTAFHRSQPAARADVRAAAGADRRAACGATASTGSPTSTSPRCCRSSTRARRAARPWCCTSATARACARSRPAAASPARWASPRSTACRWGRAAARSTRA